MISKENQITETAMLIRKPVAQVYEAFIDPAVTTKFWFTKSTGRLDEHQEVEWTWEMYNVSSPAKVISLTPNEKIIIEWGKGDDATTVEWTFKPLGPGQTFVEILQYGFKGDTNAIVRQIRDTTGGFCWVLAGLKAYLEYNIQLNLVGDRFPKI
ncbi:SRPBCC family protein [Chitinophaga solisilvae]|uniref:Polyketide cyclase n=1 Tax=Chitinophaga solisilvae TaxID=1233460 RepID=A0A433WKW7_9BACT|nr:SRPBCC family protein [Chitinophaga solisilvae]NSL85949.1 polyketide cyclase [Chitinophaga solisilvae]